MVLIGAGSLTPLFLAFVLSLQLGGLIESALPELRPQLRSPSQSKNPARAWLMTFLAWVHPATAGRSSINLQGRKARCAAILPGVLFPVS